VDAGRVTIGITAAVQNDHLSPAYELQVNRSPCNAWTVRGLVA